MFTGSVHPRGCAGRRTGAFSVTLAVLIVVVGLSTERTQARHVYPYQYEGAAMPELVRMVDDPRQVGSEDEEIVPPRYGAATSGLKTHDFYPQDTEQQSTSVKDRTPSASAIVFPVGVGEVVQPAAAPADSPVIYPQFDDGFSQRQPELVFPQVSGFEGGLECIGIGPIRTLAMNQWCTMNCNHLPAFCPTSHCACQFTNKKKRRK